MSRTLVVVRHAKSAWPDDVPDHDRPLTERGRRDAPEIGRWLASVGIAPDVAIVSTAVRARETFELLREHLPATVAAVHSAAVYGASTGDLLDLIRALDDQYACAMIVGHNPTVAMLASVLDERRAGRLEFTTSAVAVFDVGATAATWSEVNPGSARLVDSAVPRG